MGNKNRRKGHDLERWLARVFRSFGFEFCKTSRAVSSVLDGCGVDLSNIPFLIQAKSGYVKRRPKYEKLYNYTKDKLKENYPADDKHHNLPYVLVHRLDGKSPENFQWIFMNDDILPILFKYFNSDKILEAMLKAINNIKDETEREKVISEIKKSVLPVLVEASYEITNLSEIANIPKESFYSQSWDNLKNLIDECKSL